MSKNFVIVYDDGDSGEDRDEVTADEWTIHEGVLQFALNGYISAAYKNWLRFYCDGDSKEEESA